MYAIRSYYGLSVLKGSEHRVGARLRIRGASGAEVGHGTVAKLPFVAAGDVNPFPPGADAPEG